MSNSLAQMIITLQRIILPIIIILGTIGNSLNIAVLTRRTLYKHACSRYFLALSGNNLFFSSVTFTISLLADGYKIQITNTSTAGCKIYSYISSLCAFISPYVIVLASMDRCCASSANARIRRFNNIRVANLMICFVIIVFALIFIHILLMTQIVPEFGYICLIQAETLYYQVYIIIQVLLFAVVPPFLMILFGIITIKNSKQTRVVPVAISRFNRTENQLARMLFFQVGIHIFLTLPTSVTYLISTISNPIRTIPIFSFLSSIATFLFRFSVVTPFFSYILSSRVYRHQFFRVFRTLCSTYILHQGEHSLNRSVEPANISTT